MFEKTQIRRQKEKLMVRLSMSNGETVEGDVFLTRGERLADLLNDERAFLPVEVMEGKVSVVAKSGVVSVVILGEAKPIDGDPYSFLRVNSSASDAEVRDAWMAKLKSCHPDRIAALNLHDDIVRTARSLSQQVNAAYDQIVHDRRRAGQAA